LKPIFYIFLFQSLLLISSYADVIGVKGSIDFDVNFDFQSEMTLTRDGLGVGVTPSSNLHVQGNALVTGDLSVGGEGGSSNLNIHGSLGFNSPATITSNTTLSDHSVYFVDSSSDHIVVTLPYAGNVIGRMLWIKKTNPSNHVMVSCEASNFFADGFSGKRLGSGHYGALRCMSSSDNTWVILNIMDCDGHQWSLDNVNLAFRVDASKSSSIQSDGSGNVSQWNDLSENGYHLTQAADNSHPETGVETMNGLNMIKGVVN